MDHAIVFVICRLWYVTLQHLEDALLVSVAYFFVILKEVFAGTVLWIEPPIGFPILIISFLRKWQVDGDSHLSIAISEGSCRHPALARAKY